MTPSATAAAPRRSAAARYREPGRVARALGLSRSDDRLPYRDLDITKRQRMQMLLTALWTERSSFDAQYGELSDFILPKRGRFTPTSNNKGTKEMELINNSCASVSVRDLQAGLLAGMASPSRPWFVLTLHDQELAENHDVKLWLEGVRRDILRVLAESNFYPTLGMFFGDEAVFATAAMMVVPDKEDILRWYLFPVGSYAIGALGTGRICCFARRFRMTTRQLIERFGYEAVSTSAKEAWRKGITEQWFEVAHAITPSADVEDFYGMGPRKPYYECYWEECSDREQPERVEDVMLEENFLKVFPVIAGRWDLTGDDVYGTMSPGMLALPDVKQLQEMTRYANNAMAAVVKPPLQHPAGLANTQISLVPGDSNEVVNTEGGGQIKPIIEVNPHLQDLLLYIQQITQRVEGAFYRDLFRMLIDDARNQRATATEIEQRTREKLSVLGPVLERHNDDVFEPIIHLAFEYMKAVDKLPEPPPILEGRDFSIQYVSEVALAQRMVGLSGVERYVGFVTSMAQIAPPVVDNLDFDKIAEEYADMIGVPPKILRGPEDRAEVRAARAQAQQQQQAPDAMAKTAGAVKDLAGSPISKDNALGQLTGLLNEASAN